MSAFDFRLTRLVLAAIWIWSGIVSLGLYPLADSLRLVEQVGLSGEFAVAAVYLAAILDIVLGLLTLAFPHRALWAAQAAVVVVYTLVITATMPEFWLHPFGPLLKNLAVFNLLWLLHSHQGSKA